ncbi:hypothetical protein PCIT_a0289 [Pseudoalteromonas citrea]|uniref:Uncharacterized protein n=2 Tax=Pseudoalteromonas citrea TaxID=43655 RepID=A0AAD4AKL4_9GAMM|nr:hypothetical protein PCIT_a0289 [Pseudoalteromonas citrea]
MAQSIRDALKAVKRLHTYAAKIAILIQLWAWWIVHDVKLSVKLTNFYRYWV